MTQPEDSIVPDSNDAKPSDVSTGEAAWVQRVYPEGRSQLVTFSMELHDANEKPVVHLTAFITTSSPQLAADNRYHEEIEDAHGALVCYIHASSFSPAASKQALVSLLDFVTEMGCEDVYLAIDKPQPTDQLPAEALRVYRYIGFEMVHPHEHSVQNAILLRYQM